MKQVFYELRTCVRVRLRVCVRVCVCGTHRLYLPEGAEPHTFSLNVAVDYRTAPREVYVEFVPTFEFSPENKKRQ